MQHLGKWAAGIVGGVLALAVLFYAANATSAGTYNSALFLFVILLAFVFAQIKRGFDQADRDRHTGTDTPDDDRASPAGGDAGPNAPASSGAATAGSAGAATAASAGVETGRNETGRSETGGETGQRRTGTAAPGAPAGSPGKLGLSESAPSGPTNGTGAKH